MCSKFLQCYSTWTSFKVFAKCPVLWFSGVSGSVLGAGYGQLLACFPPQQDRREKIGCQKVHGLWLRHGRLLTNYCYRQNRSDLGKIDPIYFQLKYIWVVRNNESIAFFRQHQLTFLFTDLHRCSEAVSHTLPPPILLCLCGGFALS